MWWYLALLHHHHHQWTFASIVDRTMPTVVAKVVECAFVLLALAMAFLTLALNATGECIAPLAFNPSITSV